MALKVNSESFKETFTTLEAELRRRTVPDEAMSEVQKSMEKNKHIGLPEFEKVTLLWLVHHLPLKLWISALGIITVAFVAGVQIGQLSVVREFLGKSSPPQTTTIEPSVLKDRIDRLTEGYSKNVAQITGQILLEEQGAGKSTSIYERQPHIDAANRLRELLDNEHKKYRESMSELRGLQTSK